MRLGVAPGRVVQAVDVLGDERVHVRDARELGDGAVPGVRLGAPHLGAQPVLPRELPHLGIRHVVLQRRGLLGRGVLRPHAVRAAEVGDAGLGGDARAGEDHDRARVAQPAGDGVERVGRSRARWARAEGTQRVRRAVHDGGERVGRRAGGGRGGRSGAPPHPRLRPRCRGSARAPARRRRPRTRRGGARTPTPRSRGRWSGGSRCRAARARRCSRSSPCSNSMKASRRARVRACSSGVDDRRSSSHASCARCSDAGSRWTWRRLTGGTVRRTAYVREAGEQASSNCVRRSRLRNSGDDVPSRAPEAE